jgi:hypothetical protein
LRRELQSRRRWRSVYINSDSKWEGCFSGVSGARISSSDLVNDVGADLSPIPGSPRVTRGVHCASPPSGCAANPMRIVRATRGAQSILRIGALGSGSDYTVLHRIHLMASLSLNLGFWCEEVRWRRSTIRSMDSFNWYSHLFGHGLSSTGRHSLQLGGLDGLTAARQSWTVSAIRVHRTCGRTVGGVRHGRFRRTASRERRLTPMRASAEVCGRAQIDMIVPCGGRSMNGGLTKCDQVSQPAVAAIRAQVAAAEGYRGVNGSSTRSMRGILYGLWR